MYIGQTIHNDAKGGGGLCLYKFRQKECSPVTRLIVANTSIAKSRRNRLFRRDFQTDEIMKTRTYSFDLHCVIEGKKNVPLGFGHL